MRLDSIAIFYSYMAIKKPTSLRRSLPMTPDSFVRVLAGTFILASVALAHFVSPWWLLFTCFIGFNLIQSAFTGFCPPTLALRKLGWVRPDGTISWGRSHPSRSAS
jgi:hypothetical protein